MSTLLPAVTFTDTDLVDIRRFAGYPALGTGVIVFPFPWWFKYYEAVEVRLQNMTVDEGLIVQQYLIDLRKLEAAIPNTSCNLGTAVAAVWTRNPRELRERINLYTMWRRRFCGFLGIPAGPDVGAASGNMSIVV